MGSEHLEHLTVVGVAPDRLLREQQLTVDLEVEHTPAGTDQRQVLNGVLIVVQQILHRAHGAV